MRTVLRGALLLVLPLLACGVQKLDDEEPLVDRLSMTLDGALYEVDNVVDPATFDPESYDFLMGLDDTKADPRRNDPSWEYWIHARHESPYRFYFNTRRSIGTGVKTVNRAYLPRLDEPWVALVVKEGGVIQRTYLPADGSQVEIVEAGGDNSRLEARFDRLVMLDDCDQPIVLENGSFSVGLVTTEMLAEDELIRLADFGVQQEQIEGHGWLTVEGQQPLRDLAPLAFLESDGMINVILNSYCDSQLRFAASIPADAEPGEAAVTIGPAFLYLFVDHGTPTNLDDDDAYIGFEGRVRLDRNDGLGGYIEGNFVSPVRFAKVDWDTHTYDTDVSLRVTAGEFRSWITQ